MIQVFDTHRLPYHNARLRAWSNLTKTELVPFYNITDPSVTPEQNVGYVVKTNTAGYLYTMDNTEISCLSVLVPAIIEVSLDAGQSWPIKWITGQSEGETIHTEDIHVLHFKDEDGNEDTYNPLTGDKSLPDYALKSEIAPGMWAEGTMTILEATPARLNIDPWTHTIVSRAAHDNVEYEININDGRTGQVIHIVNGKPNSTLHLTTTYSDGQAAHVQYADLEFKECAVAVSCGGYPRGWILKKIDAEASDDPDEPGYDFSIFERQMDLTDDQEVAQDAAVVYNNTPNNVKSSDKKIELGAYTATLVKNSGPLAIKTTTGRVAKLNPIALTINKTSETAETRTLRITMPTGFITGNMLHLVIDKSTMAWPNNSWWCNTGLFDILEIGTEFLNQTGVPILVQIECAYSHQATTSGCSVKIAGIEVYHNDTKEFSANTIICQGYLERRALTDNSGNVLEVFWVWTPVSTKHITV